MIAAFRIFLFALLIAALPLRGYAATLKSLCDAHHGTSQLNLNTTHEHAAGDAHGGHENSGEEEKTASLCSLCATCSVGAPLAADAPRAMPALHAGVERIAFFAQHVPIVSPRHPDRPPLPL